MNISYEWLKDFIDVGLSPAELRDLLTSRCATVDEVVPLRTDLASIVVARVVEAARHPNSDRLTLTKVDAGSGELLDVVCGAPNVRAGASYPFAAVGTVLPGGVKIEKRKIRGATSNGMLCSARELDLGEEHDGILELDTGAPPGTPLLQALPVGDTRLVVDVLPNRPDLLSHLGVAREIAAAVGKPLDPLGHYRSHADDERLAQQLRPFVEAAARGSDVLAELVERREESGERVLLVSRPRLAAALPSVAVGATEGVTGEVRVAIEDLEGCPRYLGAVIRDVRVGPSPEWLVRRIEAVGGRSINNVVDVTNFMLHGYGQPMHAFDLGALAGPEVIIRRARAGEKLTTLDGVERTLDPTMTVIADADRAQALAGVIGGRDSEVTEATTSIFLEVAAFDPARVRATRKKLGLATDASYRFERGTDVDAAAAWLAHAVLLLVEVAGGDDERAVDLYPAPNPSRPVSLRVDRVRRLLGDPVSAAHIRALLEPIGFATEIAPGTEMLHGSEELRIVPPTWRRDVSREVDLIEEVARLRGYDTFPDELRPFRPGTVPDDPLWRVSRRVRETLIAEGLLEARPMPFVRGGEGARFVRVRNPLAENEAYLRRDLLDTLARRAEYNLAHMQGNVRLFEIGAAFAPSGRALPHEELRAAALVMGDRRPPHFTEPKPPSFDEWDAKALGEVLARAANPLAAISLEPGGSDFLWEIRADGSLIGRVRRLSLDAPVWAAAAFGVEVTLAILSAEPVAPPGGAAWQDTGEIRERPAPATASGPNVDVDGVSPKYRPLPMTPASEFDLALLVPESLPAGRVEAVLYAAAGELLERLELFDEYRGSGLPQGVRSLAWRLTFRHPERTLSLKEIEGRRSKLLRALDNELGVQQRTG